jgi:hypothetical protein
MIRVVLATAVVGLALAGCTSNAAAPNTSRTTTQTVTSTRTPSVVAYTPQPARTVPPLPYGAKAHRGEKDGTCPYIRTGLNEDSGGGVNLADLEGDRVYRTTVLTHYQPVGCRFYFYAPPYEAIAEILPRRFPTATDAFNAMVRTAEAGRNPITERNFVRGLTGICYQTKFFGPDGLRDWAFVFAKGRLMVVVHTQRSDTSRNALYIGRAIAGKF